MQNLIYKHFLKNNKIEKKLNEYEILLKNERVTFKNLQEINNFVLSVIKEK